MKSKVKVGFVGLGQRGAGLFLEVGGLMGTLFGIEDAVVFAVCDRYPDRVERAEKIVEEKGYDRPFTTTDYNELIKSGVDAVIVSTSWDNHVKVALASMKAGVPVAIEVGGTHSIEDCWKLVDCYEQTKTPFFFMENCCFNKDEVLVSSLIRKGILGDISYCQGCYGHDLREEICGGIDTHHYRLEEYKNHNCENYPTHELGPIAKILNINSGNKFVKLVSMSSKAQGLKSYIERSDKYKDRLNNVVFKQGDITTTMIECENGETILLKLDTTMPRLYDRGLTINGTKGYYCQTTQAIIVDGDKFNHETTEYKDAFFSQKDYYDEYLPNEWKVITDEQLKAGHGGMDHVMLDCFIKCIKDKKPFPIDVYDAVSWMCITALSEQSISEGCVPVEIPDFTRGKYKTRKTVDVLKF